MIRIIFLFSAVIISDASYAQKPLSAPIILSSEQADAVFTDSVKGRLKINYPIYRVYQFSDKSGQYYCLLTESRDSMGEKNDTINHFIRALTCRTGPAGLIKVWEMNDHVRKDLKEEDNIWFWTNYIDFKDYDNDGLIEPLIIYGSTAMNGYDDGRIRFLIYYKGQKVAIRHQNGVLDPERETTIDKAFYLLPETLQTSVKQKMKQMEEADQAIFPNGWETAIKDKRTVINER